VSAKWTAEQIPDQAGRVAVVTGAAVMAVTNRLFAQSAEMGALPALARRLWNVSEQLTGVRFALPAEAVA
jgi:hypothetical protein